MNKGTRGRAIWTRRAAKVVRWAERVISWAGIKGDAETWEKWLRRSTVLIPAASGLWGKLTGKPWWPDALLWLAGVILLAQVAVPWVVRRRKREVLPERSRTSHQEEAPHLPSPIAEFITREQAGAIIRAEPEFRSRLRRRPNPKKIERMLAEFEAEYPNDVTSEGYEQMGFRFHLSTPKTGSFHG